MADPERIFVNLPDCYDRDSSKGNYHLLAGLAYAIGAGNDSLDDFIDDLTVSSSDGDGLDRAGESLAVPRPVGLSGNDSQYRILIRTIVPVARGTIPAIRSVFEAVTGLSNVTVEDQQINPLIPPYEIWIYVTSDSYGYGAFAQINSTVRANCQEPWPPESSGFFDLVHDDVGLYGGEYNDHWWEEVSKETRDIVDSVRLAGTIIIYKPV